MEKDFLDGKIHPKKLKEILAEKIVERYHGGDIAQSILENFNLVFSKGDILKIFQNLR